MKLSKEASGVLGTFLRQYRVSVEDVRDLEEVVSLMPDDRKEIYRNVQSNPVGDLFRYSIHIRVQHLLTFTTFLLLAFTGLPIHYNDAFWAVPFNSVLGGVEVTRVVHRTLAFVMVASMVYHVMSILGGTMQRIAAGKFDIRRSILPILKDARDFAADMSYFAGQRENRPEMDKFVYKQKIHYFAAAFGNTVMVVSGSSFLFPEFWNSVLPASYASHFQEMMRLSHPHEALLALLVIAFWHWYNVHLAPGRFPMQWTFLTGKLTREHQIEEHFMEYLRNLAELPEERSYLREVLVSKQLVSKTATDDARQNSVFEDYRRWLAEKEAGDAEPVEEAELAEESQP
ncbi:cytochrome b/b6 domain-containing protein [Pseudomonadota bacterium]